MSRKSLRRPTTSDDQLALMRASVRAECRDRPGIYRMHSADGEVVYVGKSKKIRTRLLSYFRCSFPEDKGARILRDAVRIDWEYTPSEFAALLLELQQIKRLRPRFNVAMKRDDRNFVFIKIVKSPAPKLMVVRGASDDSAPHYGPFQGAQAVNEAVRELHDVLSMRDCSLDTRMHFADQRELFQIARTPGCIRYEVKKCLGPCVGGCTEKEYRQRVALARAFLDGHDDGPIATLRHEMEAASDKLEFERAASMRDKLQRLEALKQQFLRFRFAVETLSFVYTVPGFDGEDRVYLIRRGRVRAEDIPPQSERDHRRLAHLTEAVYGTAERETTQIPTHEIDELLLLSSWFRRFPGELARTMRAADVGLRPVTSAAPRVRAKKISSVLSEQRAAIGA
ncbi:MAG TPA: UvrB/UvrC motif-containing protein [Gemmatimonadaceae bacterium]|nr:UvrB/UvrC motif-containing protein [Gemmatimonadaceae bacterium]